MTSRLAPHVRGIVFTLSACDSFTVSSLGHHRPPDLAPEEDMGYECARHSFNFDYGAEQHATHACEFQGLSPECDTLLLEIIQIAAGHQGCSIGIDMQSETANYGKISKCRPQLAKDMMKNALREKCNVPSLWLSDDFPLQATHFEHGGAFESVTRGLRRFSCLLQPDDESALQTAWPQHHWRIIAAILQQAKSLEYFEIVNNSRSGRVDCGMVIPNLFAQSFAAITAPIPLRTLRLSGVNLMPHTLLKALKSCADTLEEVEMISVGLRGEGDVWSKILASLHGMGELRDLLLDCLYKGAADSATFADEGWLKLRWKSGEEVEKMYERMMVGESLDARTFLELAIKQETEYHEL